LSDGVLEQALANPLVASFPVISRSDNPKADLRQRMTVKIMNDGYMTRVALELPDANQAATIVNSVVDAYLLQNAVFDRSLDANQHETFTARRNELDDRLTQLTPSAYCAMPHSMSDFYDRLASFYHLITRPTSSADPAPCMSGSEPWPGNDWDGMLEALGCR
jgi:hypothetical protein